MSVPSARGGVDRKRLPPYGMHPREGVNAPSRGRRRCPFLDQSKCRMHTAARGMEPLTIDRTHILVLNYNGRGLLAECLPSIVAAARSSPVPCRVTVVDNGSTDGSDELVASHWPTVGFVREPNHGLASFNRVLERLDEPVVLLLNNDSSSSRRRWAAASRSLRPTATPCSPRPFAGRSTARLTKGCGRGYEPDLGLCRECAAYRVLRSCSTGRPHRRGRAGAGRRSPQVSRARGLRPDLLSGSDRRSRPGVPRLDGRLSRLLRAGVGRLSSGLRHVRASVGKRAVRRAGQPQYA